MWKDQLVDVELSLSLPSTLREREDYTTAHKVGVDRARPAERDTPGANRTMEKRDSPAERKGAGWTVPDESQKD